MLLSAPSKTFLIGEYGALVGGPALLLNTSPRFVGYVGPASEIGGSVPFHSESPAGQFYREMAAEIPNFDFRDPHEGKGGFGASSAQFLFVWALAHRKGHISTVEVDALIESYQNYSKTKGRTPSGYDVAAQALGKVAVLERSKGRYSTEDWPFEDLSFLLIRTGQKVATHSHLAGLGDVGFFQLAEIAGEAERAFREKRSDVFVDVIKSFQDRLTKSHLTLDSTLELLSELNREDGVLAAKACGAMGADVVVALVEPELRDEIQRTWGAIATEADLSPGLEVQ